MLNLRAELRAAISAAIQRAQEAGDLPKGSVPEVAVAYPPAQGGESLGEYASPVALSLAKQWKKGPLDVAEAIAKHFTPPEFVGKGEVVTPGFLNFHLRAEWLSAKIDNIIAEGSNLAQSDEGGGTSVNLEFVSGNPTGEVHMGNARALFSADVLGRVLAHVGYAVTREYYINDVGSQIERYGESVLRRILQAQGHDVEYPAELYQGDDVRSVAERVREEMEEDRGHAFSPDDLNNADIRSEVARRAMGVNLREVRRLLEEVAKVRYDVWFRESTLHEQGAVERAMEELEKRGVAVERDGALWLKATVNGETEDRVLVKRDGAPTYLASDIAYHQDKFRRGFQIIADFWGEDQYARNVSLKAALEALGEDARRLRFVLVHLVRILQSGEAKKMSKRAGTTVPLREVLDLVGLSAARFFLTMKSLSSPFDFDLDLARTQKEENPVYYAQYAYVRLTSILRKAKQQNLADGELVPPVTARIALTDPAEHRLLSLAVRLPEVLQDVARTWDVQRLPQYALELAAAVHRFYDTVPVLQAGESDALHARLALVVAVRTVLATVFDLLGIEKLEVM